MGRYNPCRKIAPEGTDEFSSEYGAGIKQYETCLATKGDSWDCDRCMRLDPKPKKEGVKKIRNTRGMAMSMTWQAIVDSGLKRFKTTDLIFNPALKDIPLSTIYDRINKLRDLGLLKKRKINKQFWYEVRRVKDA